MDKSRPAVFGDYKRAMAGKGYKEAEVDSWLSYIKERMATGKKRRNRENRSTV